MFKHIVLLASLASLGTLFGCATDVAPSEEEAPTSGASSLESAEPSDPQESEGAKCGCKSYCSLCAQLSGQCVCNWTRVSGCIRMCYVRSGDSLTPL